MQLQQWWRLACEEWLPYAVLNSIKNRQMKRNKVVHVLGHCSWPLRDLHWKIPNFNWAFFQLFSMASHENDVDLHRINKKKTILFIRFDLILWLFFFVFVFWFFVFFYFHHFFFSSIVCFFFFCFVFLFLFGGRQRRITGGCDGDEWNEIKAEYKGSKIHSSLFGNEQRMTGGQFVLLNGTQWARNVCIRSFLSMVAFKCPRLDGIGWDFVAASVGSRTKSATNKKPPTRSSQSNWKEKKNQPRLPLCLCLDFVGANASH